jgi:hypothetical protein
MKSIQVRVIDKSGNAVARKKVEIWQSGYIGGRLAEKDTDSVGSAEFMLDLKDSDKIDIHIAGQSMLKDQRPQADFRVVLP